MTQNMSERLEHLARYIYKYTKAVLYFKLLFFPFQYPGWLRTQRIHNYTRALPDTQQDYRIL